MLEANNPHLELVNYYANTSQYALDLIRRIGPLADMTLLSIGTRVAHLADYLAIFRIVHHNTLVETSLPFDSNAVASPLVMHRGDFFSLPAIQADCVISHATLHCVTDTRYGNCRSGDVSATPYQTAAKLRQVLGPARVPAIISVAVHRDEGFFDDNTHLGHEKFVRSFADEGFNLEDHFFDYVCGGIAQRPEYLNPTYRRCKQLPPSPRSNREWVIGNYYFN